MTIDDLIQKFLQAAQADDEIECYGDGDMYALHTSLYEEVITRGRDGVFVYAVPTQNEISGEQRQS